MTDSVNGLLAAESRHAVDSGAEKPDICILLLQAVVLRSELCQPRLRDKQLFAKQRVASRLCLWRHGSI